MSLPNPPHVVHIVSRKGKTRDDTAIKYRHLWRNFCGESESGHVSKLDAVDAFGIVTIFPHRRCTRLRPRQAEDHVIREAINVLGKE